MKFLVLETSERQWSILALIAFKVAYQIKWRGVAFEHSWELSDQHLGRRPILPAISRRELVFWKAPVDIKCKPLSSNESYQGLF